MGTLRTRLIVAVGMLLIATAGAGSLLLSRDTSPATTTDSSPFPVGHVFTNTEWTRVKLSLRARGFAGSAARVVSGLRLLERNNRPFALVRTRSASGRTCFLPIRGVRPGRATCSSDGRLDTPLLAFGVADGSAKQPMTAIIGIARHGIAGVSVVDPRGFASGLAIVPTTGGLWSVTGEYGSAKLIIRARAASGRVVAQTTLP
jgi:hypothetical protein